MLIACWPQRLCRHCVTALSLYPQLAPFPFDLIKEEIEKYPNADVMFVQEEHKNMGPWHYVKDRFKTVFRKMGQNDRDVK